MTDGYHYGGNIHASVTTYHIETGDAQKGIYTDINGNRATALGLIAASENRDVPSSSAAIPSPRPATFCMNWLNVKTSE